MLSWHNLMKEPSDKPDIAGHVVILCLEGSGVYNERSLKYCMGFIGYGDNEWYTTDHDCMRRARNICDNRIAECWTVIAWKEIDQFDPFEEDSE